MIRGRPAQAAWQVSAFFLVIGAAFPTLGQNGGEVFVSAHSRAAGRYNSSLTTPEFPEQENTDEPSQGALEAHAPVNLAEGPLWANVVSSLNGPQIRVGVALQAGPSTNLGSSVTGTARAKFLHYFRYSRLANNIKSARMVLRVKGSFSKSSVPLADTNGLLKIFSPDGKGYLKTTEILLEESKRFEKTVYMPVVNADELEEDLLTAFITPAVYTCECELALSLDCQTGAQNGVPLPASTFARFGSALEHPPAALMAGLEAATSSGAPADGATLVGIQFLDADGNAIDLQPGDVEIEFAPGLEFPVLGSVFRWLGNLDDFNDGEPDPDTWAAQTGTGVLEEIDFSLEYSAEAGTHSAHWPLRSNRAPLTENWEVQTDVHWEPHPFSAAGDEAGLGLRVSCDGHAAVVRMERKNSGAGTEQNFQAAESGPTTPLVTTVPAPGADGAIRLSYDADKQELSYWFDPNGPTGGYAWTLLQTSDLGPGGWDLPADSLLSVEIGGWSDATDGIPAATAWFDNFSAGSWESYEPSINEVDYGEDTITLTGFAQPNQMVVLEVSDDLESWEDEATLTAAPDGSLKHSVPREGRSKAFFRLRY